MAVPTTLVIDATQETLEITNSRDATALRGYSIETGPPTDGEGLFFQASSSEYVFRTVDESIDDRVAELIQDSAAGGLTWTYDDSAGTLTPAYVGDSTLVTTGALNSGSITSGFTSIDVGAGAITTTGTVTGGVLAGTLSTASQTNITGVGTIGTGLWQGSVVQATYGGSGLVGATDGTIAIADGAGAPTTLDVGSSTAITIVGALDAGGSITSGFGDINNGASDITTTGTVSGGVLAGTLSTAAQGNVTSLGTLTALQVDNININLNTISSTAGTDLNITPLSGQQIVLDGAIIIDAGVVTGATSITSTAFVGGLAGDVTGNADTATLATTTTVTNTTADSTYYVPLVTAYSTGSRSIYVDAGMTYNPSSNTLSIDNFVGALTGNASGTAATVTGATQDAITSAANLATVGTIGTGVWEGTDVAVAHGGTGVSTLGDGYVLLGSGTGAITALDVTADGAMLVGDGTGDPVAESGATLRTSIGVGTGDSPQFTAVNVGAASDTTLSRKSAGVLQVEANELYVQGGTDVAVADGGTGASSFTDGGVLFGSGTGAITASAVLGDGEILIGDGSTDPAVLDVGSSTAITIVGALDTGGSITSGFGAINNGASNITTTGTVSATTLTGTLSTAAQGNITSLGTLTSLASGAAVFSGVVEFPNGSVAGPSIAFDGDEHTGFYWIGNDNIGVAAGGSKVIDISGSGVTITGTLAATGNISTTGGNFSGDVTGNADTATALETARTIGGVSFNGGANIDLPGVNTAGNQNTSGSAASLSATLAVASGGTNITSYAAGDILYASGSTTLAKLAKGSDTEVLTLASGVPSWSAPGAAAAGALTGTELKSTVVTSSLTSVGTLTGLGVAKTGSSSNWAATITNNYDSSSDVSIEMAFANSSGRNSGISVSMDDANSGEYLLSLTSATVNRFKVSGDGDVNIPNGGLAIGTTSSPGYDLDVDGVAVAGTLGTVGAGSGFSDVANSIKIYTSAPDARFIAQGADGSTRGAFKFSIQESDGGNGLDPLYIKSDGNVGIGTVAPANPLHVVGDMRYQEAGDTTNFGIIQAVSDNFVLASYGTAASSGGFIFNVDDGGTSGLTIDASADVNIPNGDLGVGNTSFPTWASHYDTLHVGCGATFGGHDSTQAYCNYGTGYYVGGDPNGYRYIASSQAVFFAEMEAGGFRFANAAAGTADALFTPVTRFTIAADGKVGIGADMNKEFNLSNGPNGLENVLHFEAITDSRWSIYAYDRAGSDGYRDISFGAAKVFIQGSDGFVGINDTSPSYQLEVNGTCHVAGVFTATTKTFKIDHPLPEKKDTHDLTYSCIEGPKADLIWRGTVDLSGGSAQVDLDDAAGQSEGTFEALARDSQCWIQNDSGWSSVRGSVEGNTLKIESKDVTSGDTVSWMVVAERCDPGYLASTIVDDEGRFIVESEKEPEE